MKRSLFMLIGLLAIFLTGCGSGNECWHIYKTSCGNYIKNPCTKICDSCRFSEMPCKECLSCVSYQPSAS